MTKILFFSIIFLVFTLECNAEWRESGVMTSDSVLITYYTKGTGEPMLLIPGGPGYGASYLFSLADSLDKELSSYYRNPLHFTYIVVDLRGTGKSKISSQDIERKVSFKNIVEDFERVRKDAGYTHWSVTGHSFGGIVAEYYACELPNIIDHLILLSSADPSLDATSNISLNVKIRLTPQQFEHKLQLEKMMETGKNLDSLKRAYDRVMLPVYVYNPEDTLKLLSILKDVTMSMAVFDKMGKELYNNYKYITSSLPTLKIPVMIIHGQMDPMGEGVAYRNQKLIPNSTLYFIAEGHFLWVENCYRVGACFHEFYLPGN